jgi:hypothetical protein
MLGVPGLYEFGQVASRRGHVDRLRIARQRSKAVARLAGEYLDASDI